MALQNTFGETMPRKLFANLAAGIFCVLALAGNRAGAEVGELKVAIQDGLAYLPFIVMQHNSLVEKHARAAGVDNLKVQWSKLASSAVMNDGLLSGSLNIATGGVPGLTTLWAATRGNINVRAVGAWVSVPNYLNARNPAVKTAADFTDKDRIAVPAVKVSNQAIYLQMLAEQLYGPGNHNRFDSRTISLSHSDALTTMLSPASEVTAHFTIEPYASMEREKGAHTLLTSFDILGGPATTSLVWTTTRFFEENPKVYAAFVKAMEEAFDFIRKDARAAADFYLKATKTKESPESVSRMLNDPLIKWGIMPSNVMKQVDFMYRTGAIKVKPESWIDLFFQNVHNLPGS
jgi:NitT/TauT family transport system substrate-binding protein